MEVASALEVAIDTHCLVFLSSNETQDGKSPSFLTRTLGADPVVVVNWLWKGDIVLEYHDDHDIDCTFLNIFTARLRLNYIHAQLWHLMLRT